MGEGGGSTRQGRSSLKSPGILLDSFLTPEAPTTAPFGTSMGILGASMGHALDPSGPSMTTLRAVVGSLGASLGPLGAYLS